MENKIEMPWNTENSDTWQNERSQTKQAHTIDDMPIGMAYVPMQKWEKIYSPDVALPRGTIFQMLDLPFLGEGAV